MSASWETCKEEFDKFATFDQKFLEKVFRTAIKFNYGEVGSDSAQAFLVDGDSLLLDLLSHPKLDYSYGGQLLQLIYLLEVRVNNMLEAERIFEVVFFKALTGIWKNPNHLLAREVVKRHLKSLAGIKVHEIDNWWGPEFSSLLSVMEPGFALVSNGMAAAHLLQELTSQVLMYQALVYHLLLHSTVCVRSSEVEFKSHAMYGFHLDFTQGDRARNYFLDKGLSCSDDLIPGQASVFDLDEGVLSALKLSLPDEPAELSQPEAADPLQSDQMEAAPSKSDPATSVSKSPKGKKGSTKGKKGKKGKSKKHIPEFIPGQPYVPASATPTQAKASATPNQAKRSVAAAGGFPSWVSAPRLALAYGAAVALKASTSKHQETFIEENGGGSDSKALMEGIEAVSSALVGLLRDSKALLSDPFLCDLLDGRLIHRMKHLLAKGATLPASMATRLQAVWDAVNKAAGLASSKLEPLVQAGQDSTATTLPQLPPPAIARMDVTMLKHLAGGVDVALDAAGLLNADPIDISDQTAWFEQNRWRPYRQGLFDDGLKLEPEIKAAAWTKQEMRFQRVKKSTLKKWMENDSTRAQHRFQNYMEKYARSLKGGKIVMRDVVIAPTETEEKKKKKSAGAAGGRAEKIRAENNQKLREASLEKVERVIMMAKQQKTLEARIAYLDDGINSLTEPLSAIPGHMKLLEWCVKAWEQGKEKGKIDAAVRIWQLVNDVNRRFSKDLTPQQMVALQEYLHNMGFASAAKKMVDAYLDLPLEWSTFSLSKEEIRVKGPTTRNYQVGMSCARFQMRHAGHVMMRNVDSAPDERVSGFYPDKWQRDLLDIVDNKECALVCAPTSSGKTFISFYAMKQVLLNNKKITRNTDKGIIVYVSPNKALVNQVSADVYQRYGPVYGVFTPDYSMRVLECDVLITVPECLELMLLSPQREQWHRQIKYVIIDEIHTIGNSNDGAILQHVLLLLRAPYVALSATVGNPDQFFEWLCQINEVRGGKVHLISFSERWSDLDKSMYLPTELAKDPAENPIPLQTPDLKSKPSLVTIPPCAALGGSFGLNEKDGFPKDLAFAPHDTLLLYDRMERRSRATKLPEKIQKQLEALEPDVYFENVLCIDKKRARQYELAVKDHLVDWVRAGLHEDVDIVLQSFFKEDVEDRLTLMEKQEGKNAHKKNFVFEHFLALLKELMHTDRLPALVFCFDRGMCEELVTRTTELLERMEDKASTTENNSEAERRRQAKKAAKAAKAAKKAAAAAAKEKGLSEQDKAMQEESIAEMETALEEQDVDPQFSFIGEGEHMDAQEYSWWYRRMVRKTKWDQTHPLLRALGRGLGCHHGGMDKSYRDMVETLFRVKHLKVVVATATLALGVNMPCKTTVFALDSRDLTPMQYRQMAGRAGRRGFDNVGHVVFFGVPPDKAFRLMKSPLNSLQGHYPLTNALVLRMINYVQQTKQEKADRQLDAIKSMKGLVLKPFAFTTPSLHAPPGVVVPEEKYLGTQIQYYFRFIYEYLRRKKLVDATGQPIGMAGLVCHLFTMEPSNLVFVALINSGVLVELCQEFPSEKEKVSQQLMAILCWLFNRVPIVQDRAAVLKANATDPSSSVVLAPLPEKIQAVIDKHNQDTLTLFSDFSRALSSSKMQAAEAVLPLTKLHVGPKSADKSTVDATPLPPPTITVATEVEENKDTKQQLKEASAKKEDVEENWESWEDEAAGVEDAPESWEDDTEIKASTEAPPDTSSSSSTKSKANLAKEYTPLPMPLARSAKVNGQDLMQGLKDLAVQYDASSPFAGLSGGGDRFSSIKELQDCVRREVLLDSMMVPVLEDKDQHGQPLALNAYALDFYHHNRFTLLTLDNGLVSGEAWALLKKWDTFLRLLARSIGMMVEKPSDIKARLDAKPQSEWTKEDHSTYRFACKKIAEAAELKAQKTEDGEKANIKDPDYKRDDAIYVAFKYLYTKFHERFKAISHRAATVGGEAEDDD
eukprot:g16051.t1